MELEDFEGVIDIYCRGRAAKVYIKTGSAVAALRGLVGRLEGKQWGARPDQILPSAPQAALDIMRSQCLLSMGLGSRKLSGPRKQEHAACKLWGQFREFGLANAALQLLAKVSRLLHYIL